MLRLRDMETWITTEVEKIRTSEGETTNVSRHCERPQGARQSQSLDEIDELYERFVPIFYLLNLIFYHNNQAAEQPGLTQLAILTELTRITNP